MDKVVLNHIATNLLAKLGFVAPFRINPPFEISTRTIVVKGKAQHKFIVRIKQ